MVKIISINDQLYKLLTKKHNYLNYTIIDKAYSDIVNKKLVILTLSKVKFPQIGSLRLIMEVKIIWNHLYKVY